MLNLIPWKKGFSPVDGSRMLPFASLSRELGPMFGLLDGFWNEGDGASADPLRLDVRETDEHYLVRAEIPGLDPKDLDIQVQGDVLVLSGEKQVERDERETLTYSERAYGSFRRALRLPAPIDAEHVQARHANGVVTITLPKADSARPRRIQVETR